MFYMQQLIDILLVGICVNLYEFNHDSAHNVGMIVYILSIMLVPHSVGFEMLK